MFKNIPELNQFAKDIDKLNVLELPLNMVNDNLEHLMQTRYDEYIKLLREFGEMNNFQQDFQEIIHYLDKLHDSFMKVLRKGEIEYAQFRNILDIINDKYKLFGKALCKITEDTIFYRLCSYRNDLKEAKEFYHCPSIQIGNNKESRFGRKSDILWYLGYSKEVCIECESRKDTVCIAKFKTKKGILLNVVDLTQGTLFNNKEHKLDNICYIFWWLIASCYCGYDKYSEDSHNTYIIPQLFSKYLKESNFSIDGIKYYTVRNEKLNPNESTYVNVALFTRSYNEEGYDLALCNKFDMISSEQNIKIK